jgi:hypothetical protein
MEGSNKEEPYPITSWVLALGEEKFEGLQPTKTRVAKFTCTRTKTWSYGSVKLALGVMLLRVSFHKDLWIGFVKCFKREPKKPLQLKDNLE